MIRGHRKVPHLSRAHHLSSAVSLVSFTQSLVRWSSYLPDGMISLVLLLAQAELYSPGFPAVCQLPEMYAYCVPGFRGDPRSLLPLSLRLLQAVPFPPDRQPADLPVVASSLACYQR